MVINTHTPLLSETLKKVNNAKTKDKKIAILKEYDNEALRMVIRSSFDPKIVWKIPKGEVPYVVNEAAVDTEHTILQREARKLYNFIEGGNDPLPQFKREDMFIQMLEGLHKTEAQLLVDAKDKKLHQVYKGLSATVVKEAFGWNDNFTRE